MWPGGRAGRQGGAGGGASGRASGAPGAGLLRLLTRPAPPAARRPPHRAAGCLAIGGLLFHWFAPGGADCSLNISLITVSLVLCVVLSLVTMHPQVRGDESASRASAAAPPAPRCIRCCQPAAADAPAPLPSPPLPLPSPLQVQRGSLFPAACISLYTMYLAYSALQSEPRDYACNALGVRLSAASATTLATGVLLTLVSVVYSAFRAGSNTQTFRWAGVVGSRVVVGSSGVDGLDGPGRAARLQPRPLCFASPRGACRPRLPPCAARAGGRSR